MNKRLSTTITLCLTVLGAMAQRSYTFNAVALNVDGLPNQEISAIVTTVNLNPDGKNEAGATEFCNILANSGWDIVGFSEDFNFHSYLAAAPASTFYNFGKHSGSIETELSQAFSRAAIDGLGIAVAKHLTFTGDTNTGLQTQWNTEYGGSGLTSIGDNGADNMITKGFRMYTVTLATGVAVDVYVLHMDANTADSDDDYDSNGKDKNIVAREAQLAQLTEAVIKNMGNNKRPVIILGDTNCRYTREALKTGFIDVINADNRFTINDAWVELMWGGTYPTYGSDAMMTDAYGAQKGEVVDKIFYINTTESDLTLKANSYLHDTSLTTSDHFPVVVNFTLTNPNGLAPSEENFTIDAGNTSAPTYTGNKVTNNTTYFVKNVATGQYLKSGADYGTRAIAGSAGMAITFKSSNNNWKLYTTSTLGVLAQSEPYMDGTPGEWTLEQVSGTSYQYYIKCDNGTLSTSDDKLSKVFCVEHNANDNKQKWVLLTESQMKSEMTKGTGQHPYDVTPLVRAADFDRMDDEQGFYSYWTNADENTIGGIWWEGAEKYNGCGAIVNVTKSTTLSQTISSMPAGYYKVSFEGFYRNIKSSSDQTATATLKVGGQTFNLAQNTSTGISTDRYIPGGVFRDNDTYAQQGTFQLTESGNIAFQITNGSTTGNNWVCFDNIKLIYSADGFSDPYLEYKNLVVDKVNSTYSKVLQLNEAGQAAYDISSVIYRYNNNLITSEGIAQALCNMVDQAYANAYAAHLAAIVKQAVDNMQANGGDITGAIINPSFETGDITGWTSEGSGWDIGARENSNSTFTTTGCDGSYLFNSYGGDNDHTRGVQQTIKGIPNGLYELKAQVTSFEDRYVYIIGNSYHTKVTTTHGKTKFHDITLYFLVEDGSATIGAVGGNKGGGSTFIHYWPWEGCFFKADNFRLKYICDVPYGRLKLALDEANNATLDAYGKAALNISSYQTQYDNKSLTTDGTAEATAVRSALQAAAKAQKTAGADMTWTIENPSFETGDYTGWIVTTQWDTNVKPQENATYTIAGTDGRYLFNTWNNGDGSNNTNLPITQTITGIPNGTYKLTAMLATDNGNSLKLTGNGTSTTIAASTNGASSGVFPEVECTVSDGTLAITAEGVNGSWYKCDDFRLTYLGHKLILDEKDATSAATDDWYTSVNLTRTMKAEKWNTFVVPFDMEIPTGWEVKELTSSTQNGDNITLVFSNADAIKAGVSYMVRVSDAVQTINVSNIEVSTAFNNPFTEHVEFIGVYESGNIPEGAFFISNNVFYHAADNTNTIKGYRAYITPKISNARGMSYRTDEEDTTIFDEIDEEVSVVAIYNANGVRINEIQEGVNVLQMSNGTTIKMIIK